MEQLWPNFFIVGAARSGTTSLHEYLSRVRGIHMSHIKEPSFFAEEVGALAYHFNEEEYLSLFRPKNGENILGESSVMYLVDSSAPSRIHARISDAKIVIMLRDPIDRAYSHFLHHLRYGIDTTFDFFEAIKDDYRKEKNGIHPAFKYIEVGMYSHQVQRYIDLFGRDRVKIIIYEDEFKPKTKETVQDVVYFLGLETVVTDEVIQNVFNSSSELISESFVAPRFRLVLKMSNFLRHIRGSNLFLINITAPITSAIWNHLLVENREKPPLTHDASKFLQNIYRDDVHELCKIISMSPSWATKYNND